MTSASADRAGAPFARAASAGAGCSDALRDSAPVARRVLEQRHERAETRDTEENTMSAAIRSITVLAFITIAGCATSGHQAMSGSVVMKLSDTQAHVCLFEKEAPVGTQVQLYRHTCKSQGRGAYQCTKQSMAIGKISQTMGGHYALVTFPEGTKLEEGYTIEPML